MVYELQFVTSNPAKFEEASRFLAPLGIALSRVSLELTEIQSLSQEEVVIHKARQARQLVPTGNLLIDDSGFFLDHYRDFPGVLGKFVMKGIGREGIFKLIEGVSPAAHFVSIAALFEEGASEPMLFKGICAGKVTTQVGDVSPHTPFNSIFIPDGANVAFSEMPLEERAKYTHRIKSLEAMASWLKQEGKIDK